MEHTPILPPEMVDTFAAHGLCELLVAPLPQVARALAGFDREQLGAAIEVMIALLDAADGDPDTEADDRAGETVAMIDDPDFPPEEGEGDPDLEQTFDEDDWYDHQASGPGCPVSDPGGAGEREDDEEDDPGGGDINDEPHDPEEALTPDYGIDQTERIPDQVVIRADRDGTKPHRDRIRRTRCDRVKGFDPHGRTHVLRHGV